MRIFKTPHLTDFQKMKIFDLWNSEYPENLVFTSTLKLEEYFAGLNNAEHFFLIEDEKIIGWATVFERNKEKWFAIIVDNFYKGKRLGTKLLDELKKDENELNGWVIDHNKYLKLNRQNYPSPLGFYLKNQFKIIPNERLELDFLSAAKIKWNPNLD